MIICVSQRRIFCVRTGSRRVVAMPECTAMEANYYVREGNYFTEYNREQLQTIFDASQRNAAERILR